MGTDEALQQIRVAYRRHQTLFREAWNKGEWGGADEHWEHIKTLRRIDDSVSRKDRG